MTGTDESAPAISQQAGAAAIKSATGSTLRYRILAWITGTMLLALCVEMILDYFVKIDVSAIAWIPFVHGWVYVVYLVTVIDLWTKMRWGAGRLTTMVLAGVVPVMSFIMEKKIHAEALIKIEAARAALGSRP
ncbi:DUF3817 domain-containing protein [Rarobacter faecitabidus]|nr:DUF3817 domain-containing protein [Rarobacter faecitabidus]